MTDPGPIPWIRIVGWTVFIHMLLIALSIIEVLIYSMIIKPGQTEAFYNEHVQFSAPIVSIIFGIVLFYLVAQLLAKNRYPVRKQIAWGLPLVYIIIDIAILLFSKTDWSGQFLVLTLSFGTKFIASYLGAMRAKSP